jgi:iduronate 2-sulfatase
MKMRKILCLLTLLAILPSSFFAQAKPKVESPKMNVLFIAIDDLKPLIGAYGATQMRTPNMDRLAKMGTIFTGNYVQQAVCAPSRASLLTGMRPDTTKVWDLKTLIRDVNPSIVTLPEYFKQNGYTSIGIGKVFDQRSVDKQSDAQSWSVPYQKVKPRDFAKGFEPPSQTMYQNANTRKLFEQFVEEGKKQGMDDGDAKSYGKTKIYPAYEVSENIPDDAYTDGANAEIAVKTIAELAKKNEPFFYAVGFAKPHLPFVAPKKYWDLYDHSKISLAEFRGRSKDGAALAYPTGNVEDKTAVSSKTLPGGELQNGYTDDKGNRLASVNDQLPEDVQRNLIHAYYAAVSFTDAQVGKLLDELKKQGIEKNTIIVLFGDHGWHLGDHLLWAKHTNFEQATHAPLMIYSPDFKGNQNAAGLTEFIDVFPTLCDLTGLKTPSNLAGTSLVSLMKNPNSKGKPYSVSQYPRQKDEVMGYGIRTERFRYVAWLEKDFRSDALTMDFKQVETELYDMKNDPNETVNLAKDPKFKSEMDRHNKILMDFLKNEKPFQAAK